VSLASELLSVLDKFRAEVASHVNSGQLVTIDNHIDTLSAVALGDVQTADDKAKQVLGDLYTALHGQTTETPVAPPVDEGHAAAAVPGTAAATALATPAKTAAAAPATTSAPAATGTAG
jgi:hypothetical protein